MTLKGFLRKGMMCCIMYMFKEGKRGEVMWNEMKLMLLWSNVTLVSSIFSCSFDVYYVTHLRRRIKIFCFGLGGRTREDWLDWITWGDWFLITFYFIGWPVGWLNDLLMTFIGAAAFGLVNDLLFYFVCSFWRVYSILLKPLNLFDNMELQLWSYKQPDILRATFLMASSVLDVRSMRGAGTLVQTAI